MDTLRSLHPARVRAQGGCHPAHSAMPITNSRGSLIPHAIRADSDAQPSTDASSTPHPPAAPSRREALATAVAAAAVLPAGPSLAAGPAPGTKAREAKMVVRVTALRGSVPGAWVQDFSAAMEGYGTVALTQRSQVADIWNDLCGEVVSNKGKKGRRKGKGEPKPTTADAVTLGDAWLGPAIAQGLVQPIQDAKEHRYWKDLSPRWRQLITRGPSGQLDPSGEVWGVPYRWGCTAVLYRRDTAARWGGSRNAAISDWDDLLQPGLRGRVAFVDSPRELVGVALKTLGLGFNATAAEAAACGISSSDVASRVKALAAQVKVFSNVDHVRALQAGEVDVVVGWSDDLIPLQQRAAAAELAVPLSGTALWADLWCVPSAAAGGAEDGDPSPLLPAWLELGLAPVRRRGSLRGGASPAALPPPAPAPARACAPVRPAYKGEAHLGDNLMPADDLLARSEFLTPLDADTAAMYRQALEAAAEGA